jgi:hypothetical protein
VARLKRGGDKMEKETRTENLGNYLFPFVIPKETKEMSKKEARKLVNKLFPIKKKKGELANENKPKLQEIVGNIGNLSGDNFNYRGHITNKGTNQGVTGKREGYFLIDEKTGYAYQIPKKRVVIDDGTIEGVFTDMRNIKRDINPAEGRFYGIIKLKD